MRSFFIFNPWIIVAFVVVLPVLISLRNPLGEPKNTITQTTTRTTTSSSFSHTSFASVKTFPFDFNQRIRDGSNLQYNFYMDSFPKAEDIVRSAVADIYFDHRDLAPALLRLFFHDCFTQGCDASLLLEDNGDRNSSFEKQAIPNQKLKGFDKIDLIKEEVEQACPDIVSCADILALAARDSVLLGGGPFYPVFTGRRDSMQSFFQEATDQFPRPDDNITRTLHLFNLRGFNARETVSLLGGHNIGKIGCDFIQQKLYDFQGTGQPNPSITLDFLSLMRQNCPDSNTNNISSNGMFSTFTVSKPMNIHHYNNKGMSYVQALLSAVLSGAPFDTHYYQSLLRGRGLLFNNQSFALILFVLIGAYRRSMIFTLSSILLFLLLFPSSHAYQFDYYILSETWHATFCSTHNCRDTINSDKFTIHGLWVQNNSRSRNPPVNPKAQFKVKTASNAFFKRLELYWPNLDTEDHKLKIMSDIHNAWILKEQIKSRQTLERS